MNFYSRFPGDYARDTRDLSLAEHGAYTLLLDYLYSTERPLPKNPLGLFRVSGALTDDEKESVRKVVARFFVQTEDGYINARWQREIEFQKNRVSRARVNGSKGGRRKSGTQTEPRRNPAGSPEGTQTEPSGLPSGPPSGQAIHTHTHKEEIASAISCPPLADVVPEEPKPSKQKKQRKQPKQREPDALFDAIADVTGSDPATAGSYIGKVAASLRSSDPPYTPEDVREFHRRIADLIPPAKEGQRPTLHQLEFYIGRLRTPQTGGTNGSHSFGSRVLTADEIAHLGRNGSDSYVPPEQRNGTPVPAVPDGSTGSEGDRAEPDDSPF